MYTHTYIHTYSAIENSWFSFRAFKFLSLPGEKRTERPRMKTLLPFFSLSSEGLGLLIPLRIMWRLWVYRHPSKRHSHVSIAPIYIYIRLSRWQKTPIITTTTAEAEKKIDKEKNNNNKAQTLWWRGTVGSPEERGNGLRSIKTVVVYLSILFFFFFSFFVDYAHQSLYLTLYPLGIRGNPLPPLLWNCSLVTAYRVLWCVSVFLNSSSPSLLLRIRVFLCLFYFLRFYSRGKSETAHHQRH